MISILLNVIVYGTWWWRRWSYMQPCGVCLHGSWKRNTLECEGKAHPWSSTSDGLAAAFILMIAVQVMFGLGSVCRSIFDILFRVLQAGLSQFEWVTVRSPVYRRTGLGSRASFRGLATGAKPSRMTPVLAEDSGSQYGGDGFGFRTILSRRGQQLSSACGCCCCVRWGGFDFRHRL